MQNIEAQILSAINFQSVTNVVITAGLALIALAFLSFVLRIGQNAANGRVDDRTEDDEDKDD